MLSLNVIGKKHNKYINDRPQNGLWAGPSLLRSSAHYVSVGNLKRGNILNMDTIGIIGFIFGLAALYRVVKLEKVLKENGVIDKDFDINK
jgi:hypothetical protein